MSTSAINYKQYFSTAKIYVCITLFCILFTYIYEKFSYGQYSDYMRFMFLIPLIGGACFYFIKGIFQIPSSYYPASTYLWNIAIALFINGCLIKSIIEISGRFTSYDRIYWISGIICLLGSLFTYRIPRRVAISK